MNKNTINNLLLALGVLLLLFGFLSFLNSNMNPLNQKTSLFSIILGVFLVSKRLAKTRELPSKKFKEKLRNKD